MSAGKESTQPLLNNEEIVTAWDQDVENEAAERISTHCTVGKMFEEHPHDVLKFLQTSGVEKLAEFSAEDDLVFGAFNDDPLLTFGSEKRWIDAESEWRARLEATRKQRRGATSLQRGWKNEVSVEAFVVTIKNAAAPMSKGLLHPLIKQWQAKRCSFAVFTLPAVQSVILFKWTTFARKLLLIELIFYCVWLSSFYVFCAAIQDEDLSLPLSVLLKDTQGRLTVAAEIISLVSMSPFVLLEVGSMFAYRWGWIRDPSNLVDLLTYVLQIAIAVMHFGRIWLASRVLTYCLAVQGIVLMFRLQYYTQVLRPTRFSFLAVIREVILETGWVMVFIILTCVAFGNAFHITFRTLSDKKTPDEYNGFTRAFLACVEHLYGDIKLEDFINSHDPVFATLLALLFIFVMGYCLINLLLGMIINSLDRVLDHEGPKQLCNQARVINEVEALLPQWFEERWKEWTPAYVHVLRINPKKLDSVEMDKLWSRHGEYAPVMLKKRNGEGGADGGGGEAEKTSTGESSSGNGGNEKQGGDKMVLEKLEKLEEQMKLQREALQQLLGRLGRSTGGSSEQ